MEPAKQEKQTDIHSKYLQSEWIYKYQTSVYSHFLIFIHIRNVDTIHMCSLLVRVEKIQFFLRIGSLCQYNSIDTAYWNYWFRYFQLVENPKSCQVQDLKSSCIGKTGCIFEVMWSLAIVGSQMQRLASWQGNSQSQNHSSLGTWGGPWWMFSGK